MNPEAHRRHVEMLNRAIQLEQARHDAAHRIKKRRRKLGQSGFAVGTMSIPGAKR